MAKGSFTIDHEEIRRWAGERDGHPARVSMNGKKSVYNNHAGHAGRRGGLLRIDFGEPDASLETISWEEFFDAFEENNLAFLYQGEIDGKKSRFFKFVDRASVKDKLDDGEGDGVGMETGAGAAAGGKSGSAASKGDGSTGAVGKDEDDDEEDGDETALADDDEEDDLFDEDEDEDDDEEE